MATIQFTGTTAQQFASFVSQQLGRSYILDVNKRTGIDRLRSLVGKVEWLTRNQYFTMESEYDNALYGLNWVVVTGRVNTCAYHAICAMNTRSLCELVFKLVETGLDMGRFAEYLNKKYLPKEEQSVEVVVSPVVEEVAMIEVEAATPVKTVEAFKPVQPAILPAKTQVIIIKDGYEGIVTSYDLEEEVYNVLDTLGCSWQVSRSEIEVVSIPTIQSQIDYARVKHGSHSPQYIALRMVQQAMFIARIGGNLIEHLKECIRMSWSNKADVTILIIGIINAGGSI